MEELKKELAKIIEDNVNLSKRQMTSPEIIVGKILSHPKIAILSEDQNYSFTYNNIGDIVTDMFNALWKQGWRKVVKKEKI